MNINFRAQPDPKLSQKAITRQGQNELPFGKTTYFVCRHSPHPKSVCHIKGLNDAPVCVVRDRGYTAGNFKIPNQEQRQLLLHPGGAVDLSFPENNLPHLVQQSPRAKCSQFTDDEVAELIKRAANTPLLKRKDDPLRKYLEDHPPHTNAQPVSPLQGMHYRPVVVDNTNHPTTYLDQEIRILEKLRDILQTDSLAEIQQWLSKASLKEKEFVSNFIRSDVTSRDVLNYQQKLWNKTEAENVNLQALLKNKKITPKGSPDEEDQFRTSTQGSAASRGTRQEREKAGRLLPKRERITIPTSENLPLEPSPSRNTVQESRQHSPASSQDSTQLLYTKSRSKRPHPTSRGESRQNRLQSF